MTKHTPGPWGIVFGDVVPIVFSGKNGAMVASMGRLLDADEAMANAKLMSAAPELLAALEEVLAYCSEHGHDWMCMAEARSAILKATGEQK